MAPQKLVGPCSVIGCGSPSDSKWLCNYHYQRNRKFGFTAKINTGNKRNHPLYLIWHERKQRGSLCAEWTDFWAFVEGVGDRPSPKHFLTTIDGKLPYSAMNHRWRTKLRRREGETVKAFNARQWADRQSKDPTMERKRGLYRKYGMSDEDFQSMAVRQNFLCEICGKPETRRHWNGEICRLSVDHCHTSGKIRDLLCWRCNTTIGRVAECPDLLDAMKAYLIRHNGAKPKEAA